MTRSILRIDSSIKGAASVSYKLTDRIVDRLTAADPEARVTVRDVTNLPTIDGDWLGAAFTPAEARTPAQSATIALADRLLEEIRAADVIVIGMPIYNFAIPAQLKSWIDHLARKGETFNYTEAGPIGLLTGKRAVVAMASDGTKIGSEIDFASGYIRHMLGFFGINDVEFVSADAMVFDREAALKAAEAQVDALAA